MHTTIALRRQQQQRQQHNADTVLKHILLDALWNCYVLFIFTYLDHQRDIHRDGTCVQILFQCQLFLDKSPGMLTW